MRYLSIACLMALILCFLSDVVYAAINKPKTTPSKILQGSGSIIGGVAGKGFSLLDLRKSQDIKHKVERVVFDIGTLQGKTLKGLPGYYHAQMLQKPSRLVIDFSQMPASKVNIQEIQKRLKGSMFIKSTELALDPIDQSLSVVLFLKNNPKAKVFQVSGVKNTSKVVLDLTL